jgi:hypothetical protein
MVGVVLDKGECVKGNIQYYGEYNSTRYSCTNITGWNWDEYDIDISK